jgi:hypothetical protein
VTDNQLLVAKQDKDGDSALREGASYIAIHCREAWEFRRG